MRILTLVLSCLVFTLAAEAQPLAVRLDISPSSTLPAIPVSFRLTFVNGGPKSVAIPSEAFLLVTPSAGAPFIALWAGVTRIAPLTDEPSQVPKNGSVVRDLETDGSLMRPDWFFDDRLARPGVHQLQVFVGSSFNGDASDQVLIDSATASSNRVVLTVTSPTGQDAEIWSALLAVGNGRYDPTMLFRPAGRELAKRVVKSQPDSAYAGWFATMGAGDSAEERVETLRSWLANHPDDQLMEWRTLRVAEWEVFLSNKYLITKPEKSKAHERKARAALQKIVNAKSAAVRAGAKERLEYLSEPVILESNKP